MSAPQSKILLVLANSIKKYPNRCVAGLEMIPVGDGYNFGRWIRPIDPSTSEGEIPYQRTLVGGSPVAPLHCVKIAVDGSDGNPQHPEDWRLTPKVEFKSIGVYEHSILGGLADEAGDLWGIASADSRKVPAGTASDTLRLVKPKAPVPVEILYEYDSWKDKDVLKKYIFISAGGVAHRLTITDPFFEDRHNISPRSVSKSSPMKFSLAPDSLVVIVSLTPSYNGFHYKVAAAIIEP